MEKITIFALSLIILVISLNNPVFAEQNQEQIQNIKINIGSQNNNSINSGFQIEGELLLNAQKFLEGEALNKYENNKKDSTLAAGLSLVFPPLGSFYSTSIKKGTLRSIGYGLAMGGVYYIFERTINAVKSDHWTDDSDMFNKEYQIGSKKYTQDEYINFLKSARKNALLSTHLSLALGNSLENYDATKRFNAKLLSEIKKISISYNTNENSLNLAYNINF